jgi:NH3-dependent NAD+ synthetase
VVQPTHPSTAFEKMRLFSHESTSPLVETNAFVTFKNQFREIFAGLQEDTTEENMQPRLRAMTLMALSNKFAHSLLTTGEI